jgi:hypothetical protein
MELKMKRCQFLAFLSLLGAGAMLAHAQTPKAGELKLEPYVFESADKQKVDAELGHLFAPENRRNPNSRLIELVFVRFKSTAQKPGPPKGFRASSHLIIEGAMHSDPLFLSAPKIKDVMLEFMKGEPLSTTRIVLPALKFMQVNEQKEL